MSQISGPLAVDAGEQSTGPADGDGSLYFASQRRLIIRRFRRHRLAVLGTVVVVLIYLVALFAEFLAPGVPDSSDARYAYAPPQRLHLFDGGRLDPHVYGYQTRVNDETLERSYVPDRAQKIDVGLFVRGEPYQLWGLIGSDIHLVGPVQRDAPFHLLGADRQGRDVLTRTIYGARISMSIGLVGVGLSVILGILLGGASGYYGGRVDTLVQRLIEFFMAIPSIPLWLGLAAALPPSWGPVQTYLGITVILSLISWTDLARVVRGRFLSLRSEDFVLAAELDGIGKPRIILRHMLPSFASHIIASLTLAIPAMILAETALSFLGLGLQAPAVSWGVLLQEAQNIRALATAPWLLFPGVAVIIAVLALNFAGDGLRDSADPYGS
ncbi:ABC transporter permease [Actinopolymorpha pittospori]